MASVGKIARRGFLIGSAAVLGGAAFGVYQIAKDAPNPLESGEGIVALHRHMLDLQQQVLKPHPYQSVWWQWVANLRPIWYLYEFTDGAQRGVLLLGNPLTSLLGLPALLWCGCAAIRRDRAALAVLLLYTISLVFWMVAAKPIQFYYHYLLPHGFLLAALALALDTLWRRGWRKTALAPLFASIALFAWFFPILSAAPLAGERSFEWWMWLSSWA